MDINNFQRAGSVSNTHAGNDFERIARAFFADQGIHLARKYAVSIGVSDSKNLHSFDLGSGDPPVLVECKFHTWTQSGNMPSAKLTVWNEAMYYFHIAPRAYRKILFVLKHSRRDISLASYYLKMHGHLIPDDVEIWEYDVTTKSGAQLR